MGMRKVGLKKALPVIAGAVVLAILMICFVLPASAFELSSDMMGRVQSFLSRSEHDTLDKAALADFAEQYFTELEDDDAFSKEKRKELEVLIDNDYGSLIEYFRQNEGEQPADTARTVFDVFERMTDLQELIDYVSGRKNADLSESYSLDWYVDGDLLVGQSQYKEYDVFRYPTVDSLNLASGEYVEWNLTGLFFNKDMTRVDGTVVHVADKIVDVLKQMPEMGALYDQTTVYPGEGVIMIAMDADIGSYFTAISNLLDSSVASSEMSVIMEELFDYAVRAGVNELTVQDEWLLRIPDYSVSGMLDVMEDVRNGNLYKYVNIDVIKDQILGGDILNKVAGIDSKAPRVIEGMSYWVYDSYTLTMGTDGAADSEWEVCLAFAGDESDVSRVDTVAERLAKLINAEYRNGELAVDFTVDYGIHQLVLGEMFDAENYAEIPDTIKNMFIRVSENGVDRYYMHGDVTIGALKDALREWKNIDNVMNALLGTDMSDAESDKFAKLVDKIVDLIPSGYDGIGLNDLYKGNGAFDADAELDKTALRDRLLSAFGDFKLDILGTTIGTENIVNLLLDGIEADTIPVSIFLVFDADNPIYQYVLRNGGESLTVYLPEGENLVGVAETLLANGWMNAAIDREGYDLVFQGSDKGNTPVGDAEITYKFEPHVHTVTLTVNLLDKGSALGKTETVTSEIAYGTTINWHAVMSKLEGYTAVEGAFANAPVTMPDKAVSITVDAERNYYTVTWNVHIVDKDGTVIYEDVHTTEVAHGATPEYDGPTSFRSEFGANSEWWNEFTITDASWDKPLSAATGDVTYTVDTSEKEDTFGGAVREDANGIYINTQGDIAFDVILDRMNANVADDGDGKNITYTNTNTGLEITLTPTDQKAILTAVGSGSNVIFATSVSTYSGTNPLWKGTPKQYDITVSVDGQAIPIENLGSDNRTSLSYTKTGGSNTVVKVYVIEGDELVEVEGVSYANGVVTFSAPHYSSYVVVEETVTYTVTFEIIVYENGQFITKKIPVKGVEHGTTVDSSKLPNTTEPIYNSNKDTVYEFNRWSGSYSNVTADATVKAEYDIAYKVVFTWNGGESDPYWVKSGDALTDRPGHPADYTEGDYKYSFKGWKNESALASVTAPLTIKADYTEIFIGDETTGPVEPGTTAPDETTGPVEPGTTGPDETTGPVEPGTGIVETTQEPGTSLSTEPGTETSATPGGDDEDENGWLIFLLILIILILLAVIGFILYRLGLLPFITAWLEKKDELETEAPPVAQETEAPVVEEPVAEPSPLFIPLGEEIPEEEPEEIHYVEAVSVEDVDELMSDKTAEHVLEESVKAGGQGKLGIINVGVLHETFQAGETVNLEILKEKGMIDDNIGRLKVLASGSLNKPLTVEADAFSVQAIKMITLTGGHAVKLKNVDDQTSKSADNAE